MHQSERVTSTTSGHEALEAQDADSRDNTGEEDSDTEWEETGDCSEVGSVRPQVESRTDSMIDEYPDISGEATLLFLSLFIKFNSLLLSIS